MSHFSEFSGNEIFSNHPDDRLPMFIYLWTVFPLRLLPPIFLTVIAIIDLYGADGHWRVLRYGPEHGLSQLSVSSVLQDSRGYIWIGTGDGLNRFDGYGFEIYKHHPYEDNSLSNSRIQSIIEDGNENLWIGTRDGLNRMDRDGDGFSVFRFCEGDRFPNCRNDIHNLYQSPEGTIWMKTGSGLIKFNPVTGDFIHYHTEDAKLIPPEKTECSPMLEDGERGLWIGLANGLILYNSIDGDLKALPVGEGEGIIQSMNVINSVYEDSNGRVWIGTGSGLYWFNIEKKLFVPFHENPAKLPLQELEVNDITEDFSGNIWVATAVGLYMLDPKRKFPIYRIHDYLPDAPYEAGFVQSVLPASRDEIWVGTKGAGLYLLNRKTNYLKHYTARHPDPDYRISDDHVNVILSDRKGRIILGTNKGLDLFKGSNEGFEAYCPSQVDQDCQLFQSGRIYSVLEDYSGNLWVGTDNGLYSFSGGDMKGYYHDPEDSTTITSNMVTDLAECHEGYIWAATVNGLSRFDPRTDSFRRFFRDPAMGRFSLSHNELTALHVDNKGNLWIGSVAGLNRFYPETGFFVVVTEKDGLPNNQVCSILTDDSGSLWVSTYGGLARFDPVNMQFSLFDIADGLQNPEFINGSGARSEHGELFFGGINGVNAFFPDSVNINKHRPPVVITSFIIDKPAARRALYPGEDGVVILHPDENSFLIEFSALDYTQPDKNRYTFKLGGFDENWVYSHGSRSAKFSGIPPGSYIFTVRGSNNDNIWNNEGASLRIIILKPWWRSAFAYVSYLLLVAVLVYLIFLAGGRQLRKTREALRKREEVSAEISRQKEELTLKNKNITDSIKYAKRIQTAMMSDSRQLQRLLPESFVYYRPKDIVSGDFYWVNRKNDKIFFAVADCTGHGVPGAFMSIIGYELLRNIINVKEVESPGDILNILNDDFSSIFEADEEKNISFRDGMDIGFCVIDQKNGLLEFAGAFSPLYLARDNSITEIKGNRFSVGLMKDLVDDKFENHIIELHKDDMIYLFSDGYPDQFGGETGKKFKYRRFRHLLLNIHSFPPGEQEKLLDESIRQWMGENEQVDDMLIIGVRPGLKK